MKRTERNFVTNENLKALASAIILEHGAIDGNERGEELFQDSQLGKAINATIRVKGGRRGEILSSILELL